MVMGLLVVAAIMFVTFVGASAMTQSGEE